MINVHLELHNSFVRSTLESHDGYEVEFKNTGFFAAFSNLKDAVNWCISTQIGLINLEWPEALLKNQL